MTADRVATLRAALERIAAGRCDPRCRHPHGGWCPRHTAIVALVADDWVAPLDEPEWKAS